MPPPPALDFTKIGNPILSHSVFKCCLLNLSISLSPGQMGTLDLRARFLATSLFPIDRIVSGLGPIHII